MSGNLTGNILGEATAESDEKMLSSAFYESRSYQELVFGHDFRFVVGRRGAGKSALFRKVSEAVAREAGTLVLTEHPQEEKAIAFQAELERISTAYTDVRHISRLTWRTQVLTSGLEQVLKSYKAERVSGLAFLQDYRSRHESLFRYSGMARSLEALRLASAGRPQCSPKLLPECIADHFDLSRLQKEVSAALQVIRKHLVFFYDGLDEGWSPSPSATGVLGGLAKTAAEFREDAQGIRCVLFIRDNMLRALAEYDDDYTRNIETNTLRLQWNEDALLSLVTLRIRAALGLKGEQDIRIWNRFAERGLEGRPGFRKCLHLTLYRPRDVIALLNHAYQDAVAVGRERIIEADIEAAATRISHDRLADLCKEYAAVLPGLRYFITSFKGMASHSPYRAIKEHLERVTESPYVGVEARDFALLSTGADALNALYSVGFVGVQKQGEASVRFCHDGSNTDIRDLPDDAAIVIHPCYWRALDVTDCSSTEVLVRVDDEDDVARTTGAKSDIQDLRLRRLGRVVEELNTIPEGKSGAHAFEEWVLTPSKYLFAGGLDNIQWNPNPDGLQRRDIVGSNRGEVGFWKRLERQYEVSQFIIECKNYSKMKQDEFRQAWGYLKKPYGKCLMMVTRSKEEALDETERALVLEGYRDQECKLVFLVPASLLARAVSKMRSSKERRDDWVNTFLCKRLDTFERSYASVRAPRKR